MTEVWKDIKGYEGLYQVSNFGRVKSLERFHTTNIKGEKQMDNIELKEEERTKCEIWTRERP